MKTRNIIFAVCLLFSFVANTALVLPIADVNAQVVIAGVVKPGREPVNPPDLVPRKRYITPIPSIEVPTIPAGECRVVCDSLAGNCADQVCNACHPTNWSRCDSALPVDENGTPFPDAQPQDCRTLYNYFCRATQ